MRVFDSRKALALGLLLLASTLVVQAVVPKGTAAVKDVVFAPGGDSLEARITTTGPARFTYFELTKPRRLVVDFHDLLNGVGFKEKLVSAAGVERVRASLFESKDRKATRIVFDLEAGAQYQIVDDKSDLVRVVFTRTTAEVPAAAPLPTGPPARPVQSTLVVEAKIPSNLLTAPAIAPMSLKQQPVASRPGINLQPLTLTAQDIIAPQIVARPISSLQIGTVQTGTGQIGSGLMLASALPAGPVPQAQVSQAPPSVPGSSLSAVQSQYTGEIVSFDVRDIELKDFFRLISEISGLNIAMDQNVTGTLPLLRMTDVPWDQALDLVLKQNNLGGQLQGSILRIATNTTLQAEDAARKAQLDAKDATSPLETHTYILNYTKASAVGTTLNTSLTKRGEIVRDDRRNALIITDIPSQFSKVDQIIKFLDTASQQVEIEGRLVSANKSFSRDLGTQLGLLASRTGSTGRTQTAQGGTGLFSVGGLPLATNFPAAATSGLAFLLQPGNGVFLDGVLTMAEANGTAKLLSAPRIIAQNNQPATVSQGTQIPVQTSVNNTVSVSFINFALNLTVTPQITSAGTILLKVQLENSVPDFARAVNGIPSVATQQANTSVLIPDGGTAVIGGIYVDSDSLNVRQVPGLGSLPIIGHLFKETSTIKQTSELIFFVTPKIKPLDQVVATVPDVK